MSEFLKSALIQKQAVSAGELELINKQSLRELSAEEVFIFRLAACDNQPDRDHERFADAALEEMIPFFVGRPVLMDHSWSAGSQTARIYAAAVETNGSVKRLVLRAYIPRSEQSAGTICAIESGILRECSVGCRMAHVVCPICGEDQTKTCCEHIPGREYDGVRCIMELSGVVDAYEVSFVAVPAQPEAGIIKSKRYGGQSAPPESVPPASEDALKYAMARMELEQKRYGGMTK